MALEINLVNLGEYPNDGTGDDLRTAFEKTNANFTSLEENVVLSGINLGNGAPVLFDKSDNSLRFRTIKSLNSNLSISFDSNEISLTVKDFIDTLESDTSPKLGGNLDLNSFNIIGTGNININGTVTATNITGQVSDISNHFIEELGNVADLSPQLGQVLTWDGVQWTSASRYDFGTLSGIQNQFDLLFQFTPVDFGTLSSPNNVKLDLGFIGLPIPVPVNYQLTASVESVIEGDNLTITLTTTGLDNGTVVPYLISGVSSQDISELSLTGTFIVANNTSQIVIPITDDYISENETLTLTLTGVSPTVSVSVVIDDLSNIDGGFPSTTVFSPNFDGGFPSTTVFSPNFDGGFPSTNDVIEESLPDVIDSGSPFDFFEILVDGGAPDDDPVLIADGGLLV